MSRGGTGREGLGDTTELSEERSFSLVEDIEERPREGTLVEFEERMSSPLEFTSAELPVAEIPWDEDLKLT